MIYFDHNATTPVDEAVLEAMLPYFTKLYGNPSSLYRLGRMARSAIDTAREQLAALIDAKPSQIIFTSGGTEANALAINSLRDHPLYISALEHPSVFENTANRSNPAQTLEVNSHGLLDLDHPQWSKIAPDSWLSVMLANNETGVIQDLNALSAFCSRRKLKLHSDAVQALGKIPLSFRQLGIQMMSVSSHKIYGPKGCGALVVSDDTRPIPLQRGGDQEQALRAGTENVAAIVGFGKAAELAQQRLSINHETLLRLRNYLEQQLHSLPGIHIFSEPVPRLPNTVQFAIDGTSGEMLLMQLDRHNIAVSSGSACKAGSDSISPVLSALKITPTLARSAIRISLGRSSCQTEIDQFILVLRQILINP